MWYVFVKNLFNTAFRFRLVEEEDVVVTVERIVSVLSVDDVEKILLDDCTSDGLVSDCDDLIAFRCVSRMALFMLRVRKFLD